MDAAFFSACLLLAVSPLALYALHLWHEQGRRSDEWQAQQEESPVNTGGPLPPPPGLWRDLIAALGLSTLFLACLWLAFAY